MIYKKHHYRLQGGCWFCRDTSGSWWQMPRSWRPGKSIEGFVWR